MTSSVDTPPAELASLLVLQIVVVALVEHSICRKGQGSARGCRKRTSSYIQAKVDPEPTEKRSPLRRVPSEST